jgi:hypothetical protein
MYLAYPRRLGTFALFRRGSVRRRVRIVAVDSKGAILCDSNGCHTALGLLSAAETFAMPAKDTIRDRAKGEGGTTDHQGRDLCSVPARRRPQCRGATIWGCS